MRVELHVTSGPAKGKHFYFNTPDCFLFGRAKDAHISLPNDLYVSRQHFFLEISPPVCKLRDLNSKNGVFVNEVRYGGRIPLPKGIKQAPINEVLLKHGDKIVVGDTCITVSIQIMNAHNRIAYAQSPIRCSLCQKDMSHEIQGLEKTPLQRHICVSCREKIVIRPGAAPEKQLLLSDSPSVKRYSTRVHQLEGFQIEEKIGKGTLGTVYKAREKATGRLVAIKKFHPHIQINNEKLRLLQRELFAIQQLRHKHIVQFFGYKNIGNSLYFMFEYIDGISLRQLMLSYHGQVPLDEAIQIFWGSLEGLAFAHRAKISRRSLDGRLHTWNGVVHRELSPQNIILSKEGTTWIAKITDFHLHRSLEESGITSVSSPGSLLKEPMYWPREYLTHYKHVSPPTDVFSLAAIFYEMITGHWVRDGFQALFEQCRQNGCLPSISDYLNVIVTNPPVPIRKRNPNIPATLATVLDNALNEQELPHDEKHMTKLLEQLRYRDAAAFRDALIHALHQEDGKASPSQEMPPRSSSPAPKGKTRTSTSIMFSSAQTGESREAALLVVDLAQSTQYALDMGDTNFSTLVGKMLTRVRMHSSSRELLFLKGTGDGFLSLFRSLPAALSLALTYLREPVDPTIGVRLALHWGRIKIGVQGDILGMEVHRVSRLESINSRERLPSEKHYKDFPSTNRILMTSVGREHLPPQMQELFQPAGKFQLHGLDEACDLWVCFER
ncbi:hypothetical protein CSB45_01355 [candidate division KSB3 bacterium]|uniref:Serine/threonine protein kinase n=1 Tax=candidate division KSB3 bacterium TaxID=2044937 RepID=A0A2G6EBC7_9BACT|nr:MAG: hypothetical protein CSB45_01355 [candidate division KSB3 bacterium]PIE30757.1 MAG: hypothetical protein CSA57_01995 [candidate division KSB3 bacterium]